MKAKTIVSRLLDEKDEDDLIIQDLVRTSLFKVEWSKDALGYDKCNFDYQQIFRGYVSLVLDEPVAPTGWGKVSVSVALTSRPPRQNRSNTASISRSYAESGWQHVEVYRPCRERVKAAIEAFVRGPLQDLIVQSITQGQSAKQVEPHLKTKVKKMLGQIAFEADSLRRD